MAPSQPGTHLQQQVMEPGWQLPPRCPGAGVDACCRGINSEAGSVGGALRPRPSAWLSLFSKNTHHCSPPGAERRGLQAIVPEGVPGACISLVWPWHLRESTEAMGGSSSLHLGQSEAALGQGWLVSPRDRGTLLLPGTPVRVWVEKAVDRLKPCGVLLHAEASSHVHHVMWVLRTPIAQGNLLEQGVWR